jgi:endo-1,4-beta-mannosidase
MLSSDFTLGVNYWPRRKAMYWWSDFDEGEVREEFALIAELGMSLVRIFLLWDDFQPQPDQVSIDCLYHLEAVCDCALSAGLKLDVTFFTGHMSGPNWSPRWLLDPAVPPLPPGRLVSQGRVVEVGYRSYFTDPIARAAQRLLVRSVVGAFKDHPAIGLWNLGNEPDLFAIAPDRATGAKWVNDMTGLIKLLDPAHPVTCGLHSESLMSSGALRIDDTFAATDIAVMHSYPMYADWSRQPLDPDFVPFCCALTSALCGKPVLMEEFGGCTAPPSEDSQTWTWEAYDRSFSQFMASEEALAEYLQAVLPRLVEVGATGALVWCFADYHPSLWDKPPCVGSIHERFFGLVRPDGSLKPHAQVIQAFARTQPQVEPARRRVTLDITPDEFYADPGAHTRRLYPIYLGQSAREESTI